MCGAFSILHPFREVGRHFNAGYNEEFEKPRYNIRPSQPIPVVLNTDPKEINFALWGIHPVYDKTKKMFFINARNDSLLKPTWKHMLKEQRCLIPADGFYEWQKLDSKTKVPYRFELKTKKLFSFAGLWHMEEEKNHQVPHCVIITTEPNKLVGEVHDRMPAILTKEQEKAWLNPDLEADDLIKLLIPYKTSEMKKYQVSSLVNSPMNDSEAIIEPI